MVNAESHEAREENYSSVLEYLNPEVNPPEVVRERAEEVVIVGNRLLFKKMAGWDTEDYLNRSGLDHLSFLTDNRELYDDIEIYGEDIETRIENDERVQLWRNRRRKDSEEDASIIRTLREVVVAELVLGGSTGAADENTYVA